MLDFVSIAVIAYAIVLAIEMKLINKYLAFQDDEEYVKSQETVVFRGVVLQYENKTVINNMSFGVKKWVFLH